MIIGTIPVPWQELTYAVANGAVGATTNPTIVLGVLKKELAAWREPLQRIIDEQSRPGRRSKSPGG